MIDRIFSDLAAWAILGGIGVLAFLIGLFFKNNFKKSTDTDDPSWGDGALRGLEGLILAVIGALLARTFISLLMGWANDSPGAGLAVGWGFFIVPGLVDTIPYLVKSSPILTSVDVLMMFATVVGGVSGGFSGLWRIYAWDGLGWIAFPLDVTWALAGNTVGCLLHIINFAWAGHADEDRSNAHRYESGFCLQSGYAFTQGAVMSSLSDKPGADLYNHEVTHVWQDRIFGAMYTLTYLGWMLAWLVPSMIVAIFQVGFTHIFAGPQAWCYFNNPWETWAYSVQNASRDNIQGQSAEVKKMVWSGGWVVGWGIVFFILSGLLAVLTVKSVWFEAPANPAPTHVQGKSAPKSKPAAPSRKPANPPHK
jgi:hypothetical protein